MLSHVMPAMLPLHHATHATCSSCHCTLAPLAVLRYSFSSTVMPTLQPLRCPSATWSGSAAALVRWPPLRHRGLPLHMLRLHPILPCGDFGASTAGPSRLVCLLCTPRKPSHTMGVGAVLSILHLHQTSSHPDHTWPATLLIQYGDRCP